MSDYQLAKQSLKEETKAVADYSSRIKETKDENLKAAFQHAIPEEKDHAKRFKRIMKKSYSEEEIKEAKRMRGGD